MPHSQRDVLSSRWRQLSWYQWFRVGDRLNINTRHILSGEMTAKHGYRWPIALPKEPLVNNIQ
jgi:hypothetical protein